MKKLKKSLAILLTVLMLASFTPLFASAAVVTLNKGNCELVEAPKLSFNGGEPTSDLTIPYGTTWGDITVVGGSIKYNGQVMDGYFDWYASTKTRVPNTGVQRRVAIYFYPTDTTNYKAGSWSSTESSPLEGWPSVTVSGKQAVLVEAPTTIGGGLGSLLASVDLNGGKVTYDGAEVTDGEWAWVTRSTKLDTEGTFTYQAKWTCSGYDPLFADISVKVQQYKTVLAEAPTAAKLLSGGRLYQATLSGGKVTLEDGTDVTSVGNWAYFDMWSYPTENGYHDVQWTATGYDTITTQVYVELEMFETKLLTPPALSNIDIGAYTWQSTKTDGVVVLDDGTDTDVTSKGTWKYTFPEGVSRVYQDTVVTATWTATGYETIEVPVTLKVNQSLDYNVEVVPSFKEDVVLYADGLTWEDIELNKGVFTDKVTGAEIPGTYKYLNIENLAQANYLNYYTGQVQAHSYKTVYIHFIPDDTNLKSFAFPDSITIQQLEFTVADTFEIILNPGLYFDGSLDTSADLQFSKLDTEPAGVEISSISWSKSKFDPQTAEKGSATNVEVTIIAKSTAYKDVTATVPVTIQEDFILGGNFYYNNGKEIGQVGATNKNLNTTEENQGLILVSIKWKQIRAKGTVTISALCDGEEYIITTVSPDENGLFETVEKWQSPKNGSYTIKWTYTPSEEDTCVILKPVYTNVEPIEINIRRQYNYKIIVGDKIEEGTRYQDSYVSWYWGSFSAGSEDVLDHWEFTDSKGNVFTPVNMNGEPIDITKADNGFMMPEYDVIVTAKSASGEDISEGGSLWSFWQKLVNFIIEIYRTIIDFFVPAVAE